ncbi:MAG: Na+/melibiose symporter and related transporter [Lachnospiraceae bacterium]|jgi:GPH family glycoside/pentoside/hexuronide:cation symporter|nr:Na+/melibiose symporter and related transporter [Lachnospiraceae bacterium]
MQKKTELSTALKYFYGVGDLGFTWMSNVETFYFNAFLTNIAGFSTVTAGLIGTVTSTVDACLSWIYGAIINSIKPLKWGRYRSWLILLPWLVPFVYAFQFLKIGGDAVAPIIISIAFILSHIIWNFGYVANVSMIAVAASSGEDRAALASIRGTYNNLGGVLFSYIFPFVTGLVAFVGKDNTYAAAAFLFGVLTALGYFAHFKMFDGYEIIEEANAAAPSKQKTSVGDIVRSLNVQVVSLLIADLAKWMIKFVIAAVAAYFWEVVAKDASIQPNYILATGIAGVLGAYACKYIAKAVGNRMAMIISYIAMAAMLLIGFFMYSNTTLVFVLITLVNFFYGVAYAASPALYADAVIYSEWKTKKNAAGWISGLQNLPLKVAVMTRSIIVNACLAAGAFDAMKAAVVASVKAKATPEAIAAAEALAADPAKVEGLNKAIASGFMLIPAIALIIGLVFLLFGYTLNKEKIAQYQAEIAQNKGE